MRVEPTTGLPAIVAEFELPDGSVVTLGESAESVDAAQRERAEAAEAAKKPRKRTKSVKASEETAAESAEEQVESHEEAAAGSTTLPDDESARQSTPTQPE